MVTKPKPELKAVMLPSKEVMLKQLREKTELLGIRPQSDRFYEHYIESIANSSIIGIGLVTAWELASYDCFKDAPPAMGMNFNEVVKAIAPEIAEDAIKFRNKALV